MIRRRALLALTPDLDGAGPDRLLASLLEELGTAGAIDPGRTRVLALRGDRSGTDPDSSVRVLGPAVERTGHLAARLSPAAGPAGDRLGVAWGLLRQPARPRAGPPDLVWAEGAGALRLAAALPGPARRAPLVAHVHELGAGLRRALPGSDPARLLGRAAVVVAGSDAVRRHLVEEVGLDPGRIVTHGGWVPGLGDAGLPPVAPLRPPGVPAGALLVGAGGEPGWASGTDLFLDLARRLPPMVAGRPVHLAWLGGTGGTADTLDARRAQADVAAAGLGDRLHLGGGTGPGALAALDLLVVPARVEGRAPLALEAGARGVPVAGFRAGALPEILPPASQAACLAAPFDGAALARRVTDLLADPRGRRAHGAEVRARVLGRHRAGPVVRALWADVAARLARS